MNFRRWNDRRSVLPQDWFSRVELSKMGCRRLISWRCNAIYLTFKSRIYFPKLSYNSSMVRFTEFFRYWRSWLEWASASRIQVDLCLRLMQCSWIFVYRLMMKTIQEHESIFVVRMSLNFFIINTIFKSNAIFANSACFMELVFIVSRLKRLHAFLHKFCSHKQRVDLLF
jgi:hypothetical protein